MLKGSSHLLFSDERHLPEEYCLRTVFITTTFILFEVLVKLLHEKELYFCCSDLTHLAVFTVILEILGDASMSDYSQLDSVLGRLGSWLLQLQTLGL